MYRNVLEHIAGVGIYPVISLLIFFLFFAALITYVIKTSPLHVQKMSELPLNQNDAQKPE